MLSIFWFKEDNCFSSILHLNLCVINFLSMNSCSILSGIIISLSHAFSSNSIFLLVGIIVNKTYSRYLDCVFIINTQLRSLLLFFLISNLSFPTTFNFIGEILCLITFVTIDFLFLIIFLLSYFTTSLFIFLIYNRKLPYFINSLALDTIQLFLLVWLLMLILLSGIWLLLLF